MSNVEALIAEARHHHRFVARHLPDPDAPTLVSRLADALEALDSAPPVSDDTEWESQCKAPGEEWRDCVAPGCGNPRRKRVPAGPWEPVPDTEGSESGE